MLSNAFAVVAQKGGVAKTTSTANIAAIAGERGQRVLVVDLDEQFDLTRILGVKSKDTPGTSAHLFQARINDQDLDASQLVMSNVVPGVDLIAGDQALRAIEMQLVVQTGRETFLEKALESIAGDYDVILFDCPRSIGMLTQNAMVAAGRNLVPVAMRDPLGFQSVAVVVNESARLKDRLGVESEVVAVVRTMVEKYTLPPTERTLSYRAVNEGLMGAGFPVAKTEIPYRADFANAAAMQVPLVVKWPDSEEAYAYRRLTEELIPASVAVAA